MLGDTADKISESVSDSAIGRAFSAYDIENNDAVRSRIILFFSYLFSKLKLKNLQRKLMRGFSQSPLLSFIEYLKNRLLSSKMRQYGVMILSFGFYSFSMYLLGILSFPDYYKGSNISLGVSVLSLICSVPMLCSKKTLVECIFNSPFGFRFFNGVFGFRQENIYSEIKHKGKTTLSLVLGMLLGVSTFFVKTENMLFVIFLSILCLLVLASPEGGIVLLISFFPLCPEKLLLCFAFFIVFSYFFKIIRGKRTFKIELCDLSVIIYAAVILFGGIFSVRPTISFVNSLKLTVYMLLYFVCVNTIGSKKWISRVRTSFLFSLSLCLIVALAQSLALNSAHFLLEDNILTGTVISLFDSSDTLAFMIVICGFIPVSSFINAHNSLRRAFVLLIFSLELYCLYIINSPFAVLAFTVSVAVLLLIYSNRNIFLIILFAIMIPVSEYILPSSANQNITEFISYAKELLVSRISIWRSSLSMALDNFLGGIGKGVFPVLFPSYANEGDIAVQSPHNIYIKEIIETGIFGLLIFLIFLLLFFQSNRKVFRIKDRKIIPDTAVGLVGIIGILLCGFVYDVFSNDKIFLLFWLMISFNRATGRYNILRTREPVHNTNGGQFSCDV
ncbi:MAG: O-antigen ligase family protein [Clostridia bacterium]|nr:O-antigen ligase family protein [Clostridia bacterium]